MVCIVLWGYGWGKFLRLIIKEEVFFFFVCVLWFFEGLVIVWNKFGLVDVEFVFFDVDILILFSF